MPRRVVSILEQALVDQVTINLIYADATGQVTRHEIEPMHFALTGGRWLLVAWWRLRVDIRWFNLSRIQKATATTVTPAPATTSARSATRPSRHARPTGR